MGEIERNPEHLFFLRIQFFPDPSTKGLASGADSHSDVKNAVACHTNQLALSMGRLEMQATKDAFGGGRLVILHELGGDAALGKLIHFIGLHKVAPRILENLGRNQENTLDFQFFKSNAIIFPPIRPAARLLPHIDGRHPSSREADESQPP